MEKRYLTKEGRVNMDEITSDMIKYNITFNLMGKTLPASAYKEELSNPKSTLYKCIKLTFARYLVSLD